MGGVTWGARRIQARSVDSALTSGTVLVAGIDPGVGEQLKKTEKGVAFCESNLLKIARTIGVSDVNDAAIAQAVDRAPSGRRNFHLLCLKKLRDLVEMKGKLIRERDRLRAELGELEKLIEAYARVTVPRERLQLNDLRLKVLKELIGFFLSTLLDPAQYHGQPECRQEYYDG